MTRSSDDDATAPTVAPGAGTEPTLARTPEIAPTLAAGGTQLTVTPAPSPAPRSRTPSSGATSPAPLAGRVDALVVVEREHYEVLGEFGRGGLGRVLRARDRRTGRIVAIKEALRASPSLLARFAREAIVTANLQHPAIVPVYEVGRWRSGEPFYAMKLVAGSSLADAGHGAKTLRDRLALLPHIVDVANAVAYAHGERVIHRDLKPANVLIGDYGETVVIDWGLAKRLDDTAELAAERGEAADDDASEGQTVAGSVLGTPGYMAPEQARGELADARADVYAIGAMLYELLGGSRPYAEIKSVEAIVQLAAGSKPPRALAELAPDVPRELVAIVEHAMALDPANRYADAAALADDLERFQTGQLVGAHQYSLVALVRRWIARHRAVVAAAAIGAIVLTAVATVSIQRIRTARDAAEHSARIAQDRVAALAEEQGRQLTVTGDPARGLPFLADAVANGRRSPALDFVIAQALAPTDRVEAVLTAGPALIDELAFSPDGSRLLAFYGDGAARVWDAHAHRIVATFDHAALGGWAARGTLFVASDERGAVAVRDATTGAVLRMLPAEPDATPLEIVCSHDGNSVAISWKNGVIGWYDVARGTLLGKLAAHTAPITALAWSPDDTRLATSSEDTTAKLVRTADATVLATLAHELHVTDIEWSPDGKRVVTATAWAKPGAKAIEWDAATGKQVSELVGHEDSVESAAFSPDGKRIVTYSADKTIALWDAATGTRLAKLATGNRGLGAVFSPDGALVAARDEHGDITLVDALTGRLQATLTGHLGATTVLRFSPDGKQLASGAVDGDVRLWRLGVPPRSVAIDLGDVTAWHGMFSPDGSQLVLSGSDGVARLVDSATGAIVHALRGHTAGVGWVAYAPDRAHVATASDDGTVRVWDVATGASVLVIDARAQRVRFVAYSADGSQLATTHGDGTARLWNAATGAPIAVLKPTIGGARRAIWSPDGTRIVTPLDGGTAALWDAAGHPLGVAPALGGAFGISAAWTADGSRFVVGTASRAAGIYEGHDAQPIAELAAHTLGPIIETVRSPSADEIATAGGDGIARIWSNGTQRIAIGDGHAKLMGAGYRPDGALLATSDSDGRVQVWDVGDGRLVGELELGYPLAELRWSPQGDRIFVAAIQGGPPQIWNVPAWHGSLAELEARVRCALHWRLENAHLAPATPDPAACEH